MSTREQVELILARWGNEISRDDQMMGKILAGDSQAVDRMTASSELQLRARERAVDVLAALVEGLAPRVGDCRPWWLDTNREDAER